VMDADTNAARNILARQDDKEISLFTPYKQVKAILLPKTAEKPLALDMGMNRRQSLLALDVDNTRFKI